MFCTKCGAKLSNDCKFCTSCGTKINYSVSNPQQNIMSNEELKLRMQAQQIQIQQQQMQLQAQQLQLQQQQYNAMLKCPRCGSTSIASNKKGYGVVKGRIRCISFRWCNIRFRNCNWSRSWQYRKKQSHLYMYGLRA